MISLVHKVMAFMSTCQPSIGEESRPSERHRIWPLCLVVNFQITGREGNGATDLERMSPIP